MIKKVSLSFEEATLKKIDDYAKELGIPRNAAISVMCDTVYQQRNATAQIGSLMTAINDLQVNEPQETVIQESKELVKPKARP